MITPSLAKGWIQAIHKTVYCCVIHHPLPKALSSDMVTRYEGNKHMTKTIDCICASFSILFSLKFPMIIKVFIL